MSPILMIDEINLPLSRGGFVSEPQLRHRNNLQVVLSTATGRVPGHGTAQAQSSPYHTASCIKQTETVGLILLWSM